jgi:hypothetical protein
MSSKNNNAPLGYTEEEIPSIERETTSEYREFVQGFVDSKVRTARVQIGDRVYANVKTGLTRVSKDPQFNGAVKVHDRKVAGEKRMFIENINVKVTSTKK